MDCIVRGLEKSQTRLNDFHFSLFHIVRCVESHEVKLMDKSGTAIFV